MICVPIVCVYHNFGLCGQFHEEWQSVPTLDIVIVAHINLKHLLSSECSVSSPLDEVWELQLLFPKGWPENVREDEGIQFHLAMVITFVSFRGPLLGRTCTYVIIYTQKHTHTHIHTHTQTDTHTCTMYTQTDRHTHAHTHTHTQTHTQTHTHTSTLTHG